MEGYTVIAVLEAKQGKEAVLQSELEKVAAASRAEETNIEYRLLNSTENPQQFILFEVWQSKELHQKQFEKDYILAFAAQLEELLVSPFQCYFAEAVK